MARPGRIEAVLFDFDGTLCDTESKNLELVDDILHGMGVSVTRAELMSLAGGDDRVTLPPLLEKYGAGGRIEEYERERDGCGRDRASVLRCGQQASFLWRGSRAVVPSYAGRSRARDHSVVNMYKSGVQDGGR